MLPEDAWWPVRLGAPDGLVRGDDKVHTEVVDGLREGLVHHLQRVNRGSQHRIWPKHASLNQERNLKVRESSALADASTLAVHRHAAADHQVHRWQLRGCDLPSSLGCAFLGGRLPWGHAQALGVQQELEAAGLAMRHAVGDGEPPRWSATDSPCDDALANLKLRGPHDLRHTFSTWLEDAGIPARIIDELMGHAGGRRNGREQDGRGSVIGLRYRWTTPEMEARVVAAIEQRLAVSLAAAARVNQ
jgi:hypothetical protein